MLIAFTDRLGGRRLGGLGLGLGLLLLSFPVALVPSPLTLSHTQIHLPPAISGGTCRPGLGSVLRVVTSIVRAIDA